MRRATQFIRCDDGELVNVDHVASMRAEGKRMHLTLASGAQVTAPLPLELASLPASIALGVASTRMPLAEAQLERLRCDRG